MTTMLRLLLIAISIGTFFFMMRKIRQEKVRIEEAVFWIVFALLLVSFSVFPGLADFMAGLLGIYSTPNFLFLFIIFLLMGKLFSLTVHVSALEEKVKELVQRIALDEKKKEEEREQSGK